MIEQVIEQKVIHALEQALEGVDAQFYGAWQTYDVKALQDSSEAVVGVKVLPRSYETPTVPDAQIQVQVTVAVRADVDKGGANYLDVSDRTSKVLQGWQDKFSAAKTAFDVERGFCTTGFRLDGGDCGMDRDACVWQLSQNFTIYGIIQ